MDTSNYFEFEYSNEFKRVVTAILVFLALDAITTLLINKIVSESISFWIFNVLIALIELRLSTSIVQPIKLIRDNGSLWISEETATIQLGKKKYIIKEKNVESIEFFPSTISSVIVGGNWDAVLIKTNKEKVKVLSRPDEKEEEVENRELFHFFERLSSAFELSEEIDEEGNRIEYSYVRNKQN